MGLDMCIYKVRKLTDSEVSSLIGTDVDTLPEEISSISLEEYIDNKQMYKDIAPYLSAVRLKICGVNREKLSQDYGIPNDAYCTTSMCDDNFSYRYSWEATPHHTNGCATITFNDREQFEKEYGVWHEGDFYIWREVEIGYCSNKYDLQESLRRSCGYNIINGGYHLCNEKMLRLLKDSRVLNDLNCNNSEVIVYYEHM